jgi:hypothetical protein
MLLRFGCRNSGCDELTFLYTSSIPFVTSLNLGLCSFASSLLSKRNICNSFFSITQNGFFPSGFVIKEGNKKQMDPILNEMTMKCMEIVNYKGFLRCIPETEDEFVCQIQKYLPDEMPQDLKLSYINCFKRKTEGKISREDFLDAGNTK